MHIEILNGKRLINVIGCDKGSDEVVFCCDDGAKYRMWHRQDCCENVCIEDIAGDASDLIGLVVSAREEYRDATAEEASESGTWTFYIIQTDRGCVTLRWLGESNGYYSEGVDFEECE